jgi:GABA(A) receptor-associated protein
MTFKTEYSFIDRQKESTRILQKFPDRIPVICEREKNKNDVPELTKKKFLLPRELKMIEFIVVIRNKMNIRHEYALFVTINDIIPNSTQTMDNLYEEHKDRDGFLYVTYASENTFGSASLLEYSE